MDCPIPEISDVWTGREGEFVGEEIRSRRVSREEERFLCPDGKKGYCYVGKIKDGEWELTLITRKSSGMEC